MSNLEPSTLTLFDQFAASYGAEVDRLVRVAALGIESAGVEQATIDLLLYLDDLRQPGSTHEAVQSICALALIRLAQA
jgi:hypothetical protein